VRTPTLPPATHTNCVVVGDGTRIVAIDPASPYDEERAALDRFLDSLAAEGRRLDAILLTHRHHDHVSGAMHLSARTGAPILAHALVKEALEGQVEVTRTLRDDEVIELPGDRPGSRTRRLRCVLTEGHARGHLVYLEETSRTAIAGDMVAGVGFIVIDPPEGDMAVYLASLRRLRALDSTLLIPSHGPPIGDPARKCDEYVEHRLARERKVMLAVLEHGARTLQDVVARAYDDTPPPMHGLAARSALAHLKKLVAEAMVPAFPDWAS
jgi:glyoxylase-like metal-dependent hydrolase (beta-lactamase superfamily II)